MLIPSLFVVAGSIALQIITTTTPVYAAPAPDVVTASRPYLISTSTAVEPAKVGHQYVIATNVKSNILDKEPVVVIVEARVQGITESLSFMNTTLAPKEETGIGVSWTPKLADTYELRTFVINNIQDPMLLTNVNETLVTIQPED